MYHSLIFKDGNSSRNTWDHWHLIPSSRPVVERPDIAYKFVDIPGRDKGPLDLSDYITGKPYYTSCSGTFEFYVMNDYGEWAERKSEIASFLDGRKMQMFLEDDPGYYYYGRFYLKNWAPGENFSMVTIEYQVEPYKYSSSDGKKVVP